MGASFNTLRRYWARNTPQVVVVKRANESRTSAQEVLCTVTCPVYWRSWTRTTRSRLTFKSPLDNEAQSHVRKLKAISLSCGGSVVALRRAQAQIF